MAGRQGAALRGDEAPGCHEDGRAVRRRGGRGRDAAEPGSGRDGLLAGLPVLPAGGPWRPRARGAAGAGERAVGQGRRLPAEPVRGRAHPRPRLVAGPGDPAHRRERSVGVRRGRAG